MNKVNIPAVLLVATVVFVILFLIRSMPSEDDRKSVGNAENSALTDPLSVPTEIVDEEGRWVVMLGDVELRIPKKMRSVPPAAVYDRYPTALCLREHDELGGPRCNKQADRIRIFLMAQSLDWPPPECNVDRDYSDDLLVGPIATSNAEVDLYQSDSKTTRNYIYRIRDETCRIPKADCGALRCLTGFHLRPGVFVRYEFAEDSISHWPAIHKRVLDHVARLVDWH